MSPTWHFCPKPVHSGPRLCQHGWTYASPSEPPRCCHGAQGHAPSLCPCPAMGALIAEPPRVRAEAGPTRDTPGGLNAAPNHLRLTSRSLALHRDDGDTQLDDSTPILGGCTTHPRHHQPPAASPGAPQPRIPLRPTTQPHSPSIHHSTKRSSGPASDFFVEGMTTQYPRRLPKGDMSPNSLGWLWAKNKPGRAWRERANLDTVAAVTNSRQYACSWGTVAVAKILAAV